MLTLRCRNQTGFTLIELLVVIAIIGTLASVVLASLNSAREKARDANRVAALRSVEKALQLYWVDNGGSYPSTGGSWRSVGSTCTSYGAYGDNAIPGLVSGGYISELPRDPKPVGTSGCFLYRSNGTDYIFLAHQTIESFVPEDTNHPLDRQNYDQQSIAVWSEGARDW